MGDSIGGRLRNASRWIGNAPYLENVSRSPSSRPSPPSRRSSRRLFSDCSMALPPTPAPDIPKNRRTIHRLRGERAGVRASVPTSVRQGRVQRPGGFLRASPFDGDKSPAQSGENSPHSTSPWLRPCRAVLFSALLIAIGNRSQADSAAPANGNRLTYLDESDPFYVGLNFPKLITPQWVGEPGVSFAPSWSGSNELMAARRSAS